MGLLEDAMKLLVTLTTAGLALAAALALRWAPLRPGTGLVAVMGVAALLVFAALWWLIRERRWMAALAGAAAVVVGMAGVAAYSVPRRELLAASEAELVGTYRMSRAEGRLEIALRPDGTFTHALVEPASPRVQQGRWRAFHDNGRPNSTVSFDGYGTACVVPEEQCQLARYMGQALASGFYEVAQVCKVDGRLALCFNEKDEYVRR